MSGRSGSERTCFASSVPDSGTAFAYLCGPAIASWDRKKALEEGTAPTPRFLESTIANLVHRLHPRADQARGLRLKSRRAPSARHASKPRRSSYSIFKIGPVTRTTLEPPPRVGTQEGVRRKVSNTSENPVRART